MQECFIYEPIQVMAIFESIMFSNLNNAKHTGNEKLEDHFKSLKQVVNLNWL